MTDWVVLGAVFTLGVAYNLVTIPFPPLEAAILAVGAGVNPLLVALFAAAGSTVGKTFMYTIGRGSRRLLSQATLENLNFARQLFERYGPFAIVITTASPLPDDPLIVVAGMAGYKLAFCLGYAFLGKLLWLGAVTTIGGGIFQEVAGFFGFREVAGFFGFAREPLGSAFLVLCILAVTAASAYIATRINWAKVLRALHILPEGS